MSRPRYFWFGFIQATVRRYPDGLNRRSVQGAIAAGAIEAAMEETARMPNDGKDRTRLIDAVYIKNTHTLAGAAEMLHISKSTAQRWNQRFIYLVAEKMGYI